MAMITIGATPLPNPAKYSVDLQDLDSDNTARSETGVLTRDRVRAGVYSVKCTFKVSKTQLKTITDAIAPASFSMTFFDPTTGTNPTITAYAGNRSCDLVGYKTGAESASRWELSVDFIQF
jgi:hypothetical protein